MWTVPGRSRLSSSSSSFSTRCLFIRRLLALKCPCGIQWRTNVTQHCFSLSENNNESPPLLVPPIGFVNATFLRKAWFRCLLRRRESDDCIEQQKRGNFLLTSMPAVSPPLITKELVRKSEAFWRFYDSSGCSSEIDSVSLNSCP